MSKPAALRALAAATTTIITMSGARSMAADPVPFELIPTQAVQPGSSTTLLLDDYALEAPGAFDSAATGPIGHRYDAAANELTLLVPEDTSGVLRADLRFARASLSLLIRAEPQPVHHFRYQPGAGKPAKKVFLVGDFNQWNASNTPLAGPGPDGAFEASVEMEPGRQKYKFVVDGNWTHDPANPQREPDGFKGFNSIADVAGSQIGAPRIRRIAASAASEADGAGPSYMLTFVPGESGAGVDPASLMVFLGNAPLDSALVRADGNRIRIAIPPLPDGRHPIRVNARDTFGRWAIEAGFHHAQGKAPHDWKDDILYFAFTDRFHNGDRDNDDPVKDKRLAPRANYLGGDWAGIRKKIEEGYFSDLGITAIWISPVNENADGAWQDSEPPNRFYSSYHGYWPVAQRKPNRRFGSMDDLKALVAAAHKRDIKVIVDFVSNHVHQDHPWFKEHPEWMGTFHLDDGTTNLRKFDEHPLTTWFDAFMPDLDYDKSPELLRLAVADAIWWAEEAGFDGYRHDATKHVSHAFWRAMTRAVKQLEAKRGTTVYQVGESIVGPRKLMEYVNAGELDGQFDFPLYWDIRDAFGTESKGFDSLDKTVHRVIDFYGPWARNSAFVGNHDFARFMAYADGHLTNGDMVVEREYGWKHDMQTTNPASYRRIMNAFTFLMTLPEVPMIYYGDEIGMTGAGDPDNRRMMQFGGEVSANQRRVFDHVAAAIRVRKNHPALREGDITTLHADETAYVYLRTTFNDSVLVAINRASKPRTIEVALPKWLPASGKPKPAVGEATAQPVEMGLKVTIPPASSAILEWPGNDS